MKKNGIVVVRELLREYADLLEDSSAAAKAGLEASEVAEKVDGVLLMVGIGYDSIGKLQYIAATRGLTQADAEYAARRVDLPKGEEELFAELYQQQKKTEES